MRYFETSNANREYKVGGYSYRFDPADSFGGAWSGVLAIENEEAATVLADNLNTFPQIKEISEEDYLAVKKKLQQRSASSNHWRDQSLTPPRPSLHVARAEAEATPNSNSSDSQPTLTVDEAVKVAPAAIVDELGEAEPTAPVKKARKR